MFHLDLAHYEKGRKAAFFWIGTPRKSMLGLWEKPEHEVNIRHFALECDAHWIINDSVDFLKSNGLTIRDYKGYRCELPMEFAWMPAVSVYFNDPDGHELEFIGLLSGGQNPALGVVTYSNWLSMNSNNI